MKHKYILSLVVALAAPALLANQVTFTGGGGYGPYQMGGGGEFTLRPDAQLSWVLGFYSSQAKNLAGLEGTFQSFCVEESEYISPNATYDAVINNHTEFGGVALTKGAAWLYSQFATGQLGGYDYATRTTAGELQNTLWWLMGQLPSEPANTFSTEVVNQFGLAVAFDPNNDLYPVRVLNLWDPGYVGQAGHQHQDQLVMDPPPTVPDGGATAALLGLGLVGLGVVARRLRK